MTSTTQVPPAPGGLAPPSWAEIDWSPYVRDEQVLGRRLRFLDYGEGPPLMLVHGLGGSWQAWLENIQALGRANRVIAVDLPGFGGSECLPPGPEIKGYSETLVALLDRLGLDRVLLGGHSFGGLVATRVGLDHPDRLTALALVNAGGVALGPIRLAIIVRSFLVFNALFNRPGVSRAVALRPRLRRLMVAGFLHDRRSLSRQLALETLPLMAAPGFADAVRAGAGAGSGPSAARIGVPALLLWGRHDRIVPLSGAEELAAELPDARLEIVDGAAHCPMFERPEEFNALLGAFAAEQAAKRS